ncbi:hypothetical protein EXN66_Car016237 [Channa argus]|uniref:Uncharacterized protein n=1 Tax=Channa argus TaxID=215402 RepID=A0A6G1QD04_CHAAH|nr:hypothetical protein EXN66_Car016237 [Channa argus]
MTTHCNLCFCLAQLIKSLVGDQFIISLHQGLQKIKTMNLQLIFECFQSNDTSSFLPLSSCELFL